MRGLAELLGFALLAGCTTYQSHGVRPLRPLELATAPYQETISSSLTGSLIYEGGCLLFKEDQTKAHFLPVWPTGSIFNGTALTFHQPGKADQPVLVGEELVIEGQPSPWSALPPSSFAPFQQQCAAEPFMVSRVHPAD